MNPHDTFLTALHETLRQQNPDLRLVRQDYDLIGGGRNLTLELGDDGSTRSPWTHKITILEYDNPTHHDVCGIFRPIKYGDIRLSARLPRTCDQPDYPSYRLGGLSEPGTIDRITKWLREAGYKCEAVF